MKLADVGRWLGAGAVVAGLSGWMAAAPAAELRTVSGHVPEAVKRLQPTGRLPATNRLALALGLPLQNPEELKTLLRQIYEPGSANYHRYLTAKEFAVR